MSDLPTLRRELVAMLTDTDTDLEHVRETVDSIVGEIERLVRAADDSPPAQPD